VPQQPVHDRSGRHRRSRDHARNSQWRRARVARRPVIHAMTLLRPFYSASALVAVLAMPAGGQQIERVTVPLTEPGRPAVIRVGLVSGSITVRGTNRRDVAIEAQSRGQDERDGSSPGAPTLDRKSVV